MEVGKVFVISVDPFSVNIKAKHKVIVMFINFYHFSISYRLYLSYSHTHFVVNLISIIKKEISIAVGKGFLVYPEIKTLEFEDEVENF